MLERPAGAACDGCQRLFVDCDRQTRLAPDALVEPVKESPSADEHEPSIGDVRRQLRRCALEQVLDCVDDLGEGVLERLPQELAVDARAAQQPGAHVSAGDLGGRRYRAGDRAADLDLELLGLLLADEQLLVALDGADDGVVELVAADTDRMRDDESAESGDRDLARPSADVDDQRADRLAHRKTGADCRRERLVDQRGVPGAGGEGCLLHRAPLHLGDPARHAHHHL